jgi:FtsZ-interacting cell division protein ZipA
MTTTQIVLVTVAVLVLLAVVAAALWQQRRRRRLRDRFGPEYERTVERTDRRTAERELAEREERRRQLDIRPLPPEERAAFAERWRETQEDFVDRPATAIQQADLLVADVMSRRGYPVGDFDQQARDVSVDHAQVVEEYRAAHDISLANDRHDATTEELRQAMVHYRALFAALLADEQDEEDTRTIDLTDTHDRDTTRQ